METLDGKILKESEPCWVSLQCPEGIHKLSPNPRPAVYLDEQAKRQGYDFSCKTKCDCEAEVIAVWKEKPTVVRN